MARTLIIGIGNPLRGDDGLGWRALEMLERHTEALGARASRPPFETVVCHQLTPELAEPISRAAQVIFIDACVGSPPGKIRVDHLAADSAVGGFTHRLDPQGLMNYCRELYGTCPEAWTISMTGAEYGYSEGLSAAVESRLAALVAVAAQAVLAPESKAASSVPERGATLTRPPSTPRESLPSSAARTGGSA
jgi:hydrogenase maturation protease